MNFSLQPSHVRVDIFKPSGKWFETIELVMDMKKWDRETLIHDSFREVLHKKLGDTHLNGMYAVCLEPYHECAHPLMIIIGER